MPLTPEQRAERDAFALMLFQAAARKFIAKVDCGNARSVETYRDLKEALEASEREGD